MRLVAGILGVAVLVLIALVLLGFINFDQTRKAVVQAPQFKVNVGKLAVGQKEETVKVPTLSVEKPANSSAPTQ